MPEREILFRGKSKDNGEWVYGYVFDDGIAGSKRMFVGGLVITDNRKSDSSRYEVGIDFDEIIPETMGEFTGLTDKNGVKIFEGDILRHDTGTIHKVVFEQRNGSAYFGWVMGGQETWHFDIGFLRQLEVIGNIHDNPELLEGGSET